MNPRSPDPKLREVAARESACPLSSMRLMLGLVALIAAVEVGVTLLQPHAEPLSRKLAGALVQAAILCAVVVPVTWLFVIAPLRRRAEVRSRHTDVILRHAGDSIVMIDTRGNVVFANEATERIFGWPPDELVGQNVNVLMDSPFAEAHEACIQNYLKTGEARILDHRREVTARHRDGTEVPVHLVVSEVGQGHDRRFVGVLRDVSDLKEVEAVLTRARDLAETADQTRARFVASLAGELRSGIHALTDLMLACPRVAEQCASTATVRSCGDSLVAMADQILDLAGQASDRNAALESSTAVDTSCAREDHRPAA